MRIGCTLLEQLGALHAQGTAHGGLSLASLSLDALMRSPPVPWALPGDRGRRQDPRSLALIMASLLVGQHCSSVLPAQKALPEGDPLSDMLCRLSNWIDDTPSALRALRALGPVDPRTRRPRGLDRAMLLLTLLAAEVVYLSEAGLAFVP